MSSLSIVRALSSERYMHHQTFLCKKNHIKQYFCSIHPLNSVGFSTKMYSSWALNYVYPCLDYFPRQYLILTLIIPRGYI